MKESKKIKVLFIPVWYPSEKHPVSGIFVQEHAKAVSSYCNLRILHTERADNFKTRIFQYEEEVEDGLKTLRVKFRKSPIPKTTYFLYLWSIWNGFRILLKQGWKPDIIHAHVYSAGVPAVLIGKMYKIPVVITEHWGGFLRGEANNFQILMARYAMNRAKFIIPVSNSLKEAIKSIGITNVFEIIPNTVNTAIFYPSVKKEKKEIKRILFVAGLIPVKGLPYTFEALSIIKTQRKDFQLNIIGDGPYRIKYEDMVKELGLVQFVTFYGLKTKTEIAEFMRDSDFFVLPSLSENLPCVLIEAMASELPILATNVGGIPEILNKDAGILINPEDTKSLTNGINYMLDNSQGYSAEKISQYAKEDFSYEIVGEKY